MEYQNTPEYQQVDATLEDLIANGIENGITLPTYANVEVSHFHPDEFGECDFHPDYLMPVIILETGEDFKAYCLEPVLSNSPHRVFRIVMGTGGTSEIARRHCLAHKIEQLNEESTAIDQYLQERRAIERQTCSVLTEGNTEPEAGL